MGLNSSKEQNEKWPFCRGSFQNILCYKSTWLDCTNQITQMKEILGNMLRTELDIGKHPWEGNSGI